MDKKYRLKELREIHECKEGTEINLHLKDGQLMSGIFDGIADDEEVVLKSLSGGSRLGFRLSSIDNYSELVPEKKTGIDLIETERKRQIEVEGWDEEHDEDHTSMCLTTAAVSYALDVAAEHADVAKSWKEIFKKHSVELWPFDLEWYKPTPTDPVRQLVKAGALIAAEIDRLLAIE